MIIASQGFFGNAAGWGTAILAGVAIIGLLFAALGWLFKRGADERELTIAIKTHAAATDNLANQVQEIGHSFRLLEGKVNDHEVRITVSEQQITTNARDISRLWPSPLRQEGQQT
jgi:hypothetical protein